MVKKIPAAFVTPRDAIDCNQLRSLLSGRENIQPYYRNTFRVGQKAVVWLNIGATYTPDVGTALDGMQSYPTITVSELAQQLALH